MTEVGYIQQNQKQFFAVKERGFYKTYSFSVTKQGPYTWAARQWQPGYVFQPKTDMYLEEIRCRIWISDLSGKLLRIGYNYGTWFANAPTAANVIDPLTDEFIQFSPAAPNSTALQFYITDNVPEYVRQFTGLKLSSNVQYGTYFGPGADLVLAEIFNVDFSLRVRQDI